MVTIPSTLCTHYNRTKKPKARQSIIIDLYRAFGTFLFEPARNAAAKELLNPLNCSPAALNRREATL